MGCLAQSRLVLGTPKQMTIACKCGTWYVSIQTERYIDDPVPRSDRAVGIDMGIKKFAAMSDETYTEPQNSFPSHEKKLAKLQR
ncbi:MAG: transposase [Desulfovibrio sp.]|nr:transposase [Desulfovibrio sp.]